jgi:acetyl esterase
MSAVDFSGLDLDEELKPPLQLLVPVDFQDMAIARAAVVATRKRLTEAGLLPDDPVGLVVKDGAVPRDDGGLIPVRLYSRTDVAEPVGVFIHLHGGGFTVGDLDDERAWCARLASAGVTVISVGYRLAPEHPFPAGLNDAYTVLYAARDLAGLPDAGIVVGGLSAGASLAAALALLVRERGGPPIRLQVLSQPCLDPRLATPSMTLPRNVTARERVDRAWTHYAGTERPLPALAAPAMADDLAGLPPALITVAEFDSLIDEALEYGRRLREAGVATSIYFAQRAYHGFDQSAPLSKVAVAMHEEISRAVVSALVP